MSIDNEFGDNEFNQPPRLLPRTIEDLLQSWAVRAGGFALIACGAIIWGAMLTWSANDPSLSLNTSEPAKNLLGMPGAMVADFFFHTLGMSVVFFVVPFVVLGLQLALGDTITDHRRRLVLAAIATVAIAGGCSALPLTQHWPLELGYGGIIGDFAYNLVGGILAELVPDAAGWMTGLFYFSVGFWAFSRAVCLDRYNVFALRFAKPAPIARPTISDTDDVLQPESHARRGVFHSLSQLTRSRLAPKRATAGDERLKTGASQRARAASQFETEALQFEPQPPQWSPDSRMQDYVEGNSTSNDDWPEKDDVQQPQTEDHPHLTSWMAARFANGTAASETTAAGVDYEHRTVLLDDGHKSSEDDLPNVLKRARQEAAEILPSRGTLQVRLAERPATQPLHPPPLDELYDSVGTTKPSPSVIATGYRRPSLNLLTSQKAARPSADVSPSVLQGRARILEDVLGDFRIQGEIRDVRPGPVITLFELEPARGTKSSRVISLADDVARSMSATSARIAVVPGRNAIGIELPNTRRETFGLRELIDSEAFIDSSAKLPLVLGKGIGGEPVLADLARMPHLLVAGTTGSGKSVGVNAMILSLIYRLGPKNCRFLMIDPKMLELSTYNGIPHLLTPVITDPQKAVTALAWAVGEMEERYKRMAELGVRSIEAFNNRVSHAARGGEKLGRTVQTGFDPKTGEAIFEETSFNAEPLPYIVIVVDEFADLMAVAGKEIEGLVQRLAQMARAAGIHLIMATQRPSVDVVTGTIKANFPTRISYRVASRIDSRTILNEQGGEQLLGQGDMLFMSETGTMQRVHGPFVSDGEVEAIASSLRGSYPPDYVGDVLAAATEPASVPNGTGFKQSDLYDQAVEIVQRDQKASTSYLQRRLAIGYNRAADLIDRMEAEGIIGAADHAGRRAILLAG